MFKTGDRVFFVTGVFRRKHHFGSVTDAVDQSAPEVLQNPDNLVRVRLDEGPVVWLPDTELSSVDEAQGI